VSQIIELLTKISYASKVCKGITRSI